MKKVVKKKKKDRSMTRQEAIRILANYVDNFIRINNFWEDEAYEQEVQSLIKIYGKGIVPKQ